MLEFLDNKFQMMVLLFPGHITIIVWLIEVWVIDYDFVHSTDRERESNYKYLVPHLQIFKMWPNENSR